MADEIAFEAGLDTSRFEAGLRRMEQGLSGIQRKLMEVGKSQGPVPRAPSQPVQAAHPNPGLIGLSPNNPAFLRMLGAVQAPQHQQPRPNEPSGSSSQPLHVRIVGQPAQQPQHHSYSQPRNALGHYQARQPAAGAPGGGAGFAAGLGGLASGGGSAVGAGVGSVLGPLGTAAGGLIGGMAGGALGNAFSGALGYVLQAVREQSEEYAREGSMLRFTERGRSGSFFDTSYAIGERRGFGRDEVLEGLQELGRGGTPSMPSLVSATNVARTYGMSLGESAGLFGRARQSGAIGAEGGPSFAFELAAAIDKGGMQARAAEASEAMVGLLEEATARLGNLDEGQRRNILNASAMLSATGISALQGQRGAGVIRTMGERIASDDGPMGALVATYIARGRQRRGESTSIFDIEKAREEGATAQNLQDTFSGLASDVGTGAQSEQMAARVLKLWGVGGIGVGQDLFRQYASGKLDFSSLNLAGGRSALQSGVARDQEHRDGLLAKSREVQLGFEELRREIGSFAIPHVRAFQGALLDGAHGVSAILKDLAGQFKAVSDSMRGAGYAPAGGGGGVGASAVGAAGAAASGAGQAIAGTGIGGALYDHGYRVMGAAERAAGGLGAPSGAPNTLGQGLASNASRLITENHYRYTPTSSGAGARQFIVGVCQDYVNDAWAKMGVDLARAFNGSGGDARWTPHTMRQLASNPNFETILPGMAPGQAGDMVYFGAGGRGSRARDGVGHVGMIMGQNDDGSYRVAESFRSGRPAQIRNHSIANMRSLHRLTPAAQARLMALPPEKRTEALTRMMQESRLVGPSRSQYQNDHNDAFAERAQAMSLVEGAIARGQIPEAARAQAIELVLKLWRTPAHAQGAVREQLRGMGMLGRPGGAVYTDSPAGQRQAPAPMSPPKPAPPAPSGTRTGPASGAMQVSMTFNITGAQDDEALARRVAAQVQAAMVNAAGVQQQRVV